MQIEFTKMHGLGNDFIVINALETPFGLSSEQIMQLANRRTGVGFDQLLIVEPADSADVDFSYRIFNADGGEVENCGNGSRCFAQYVIDKGLTDRRQMVVSTCEGPIELSLIEDDLVSVRMSVPVFEPDEVPFVAERAANSYDLDVDGENIQVGVVALGNPHAVIQVKDVERAEVQRLGQLIERHERFPRRVNVGFMKVNTRTEIQLRVFERGVGETMACGTGACAAVVVGIAQGLLDREVTVRLAGGNLRIKWPDNNASVEMIGPSETVFEGRIEQ